MTMPNGRRASVFAKREMRVQSAMVVGVSFPVLFIIIIYIFDFFSIRSSIYPFLPSPLSLPIPPRTISFRFFLFGMVGPIILRSPREELRTATCDEHYIVDNKNVKQMALNRRASILHLQLRLSDYTICVSQQIII